jgi:hypothetical protein
MNLRDATHFICSQIWLVGSVASQSGWQSLFMTLMGAAFLVLYFVGDYLVSKRAI